MNIADKGYLAVKPQVAANTPVKPNNFLPYITDSVKTNQNFTRDMRLFGIDWVGIDLLRGSKDHAGNIEFYADPFTLGHILNMTAKKGATTNDAGTPPVYTHPFTAEDSDIYTIEFSVGGYYARRYYDVRVNEFTLSVDSGKIKVITDVKAGGEWSVRNLKAALSGAVTTFDFTQEYSNTPNKGLCVGDVLVIGSTQVTITEVNTDGQGVTFGSTSITASAGDPVYLKCQTPSYTDIRPILMFDNALVGLGATAAAALANATCANQTPVYELSVSLNNNLLTAPVSGDNCGARTIQSQAKQGTLTIKRLFSDITQVQKWINKGKQAFVIRMLGTFGNDATQEELRITINNAKLITNNQPINQGEFIYDEQEFATLYDTSDAQAIKFELLNLEDGTSY